jgi:hypothetical protein
MSNGNGSEYDTPVVIQRPVLNDSNRPLVMVLHNLALQLEAFPRALADIARTIQLAPDQATDLQKARIAKVIEEQGAAVLLRGAQAVKEA